MPYLIIGKSQRVKDLNSLVGCEVPITTMRHYFYHIALEKFFQCCIPITGEFVQCTMLLICFPKSISCSYPGIAFGVLFNILYSKLFAGIEIPEFACAV